MPFNQRLDRLHPTDETWQEASVADRLAFHRQAGRLAVEIKRGELARGIGANGRKMKARKHPRPDGATGPVLTPHREDSRTARLMASHCRTDSITLFWRSGLSKAQRLPWATILGFHAAGAGNLPIRDVRLSKAGIGRLKAQLAVWWERNHAPRLRKAREERLIAEERARRAERRKRPGLVANAKRARDAMVAKYPKLAPYLGGGS